MSMKPSPATLTLHTNRENLGLDFVPRLRSNRDLFSPRSSDARVSLSPNDTLNKLLG